MKKICILGLTALMGIGAMAQQTLLKEAEKAKTPQEAVTILTPAFSNPETANQAQTYVIPGKLAFKIYDNFIGERSITGTLSEDKVAQMPELLLIGYDYYLKALPLDTVVEVDKKGNEKVKTKYSKDIVNALLGHYPDLNQIGNQAFNEQDYEKGHKAWSYYIDIAENPAFAPQLEKMKVMPADTTIGEINFYRGFASFRMENNEAAFEEFKAAVEHGYTTKDAFNYAIYMGQQVPGKTEEILDLCAIANKLYGHETPDYIGQIINTCLQNKDYDRAIKSIDEAIALNPDNSEYYVIKGVIYENFEDKGDPLAMYEKAVALNAENPQAQSYYGRKLVEKAARIYDAAPSDGAGFNKVFNEEVKPLLNNAAVALEKAYQLNNEDLDALKMLEQTYYLLNDEANLTRVQNLIKTF